MKQLAWKLILPLTVISFTIFTKWWYVLVIDGPDEILYGFPLPFVCNGWHTSMSLQFFIVELLFDFLCYFSTWIAVIFIINQYFINIRPGKPVVIPLLSISVLIVVIAGLIAGMPDNHFYLKRKFEMEIMETGYKFIWEKQFRPDYYKYHPERKKERSISFQ